MNSRGFTLIELLVVITIIAILATVGLLYYSNFQKSARDAKRQSDLKLIQSALEQYHADQIFYPDPNSITFGSILTNPSGNKTYLSIVPDDPLSTAHYSYTLLPNNYCLYAKMETTSISMTAPPLPCPPFTSGYTYAVTRP